MDCLKINKTLKNLYLGCKKCFFKKLIIIFTKIIKKIGNKLEENGLKLIMKSLESNYTLSVLNLEGCKISLEKFEILKRKLDKEEIISRKLKILISKNIFSILKTHKKEKEKEKKKEYIIDKKFFIDAEIIF